MKKEPTRVNMDGCTAAAYVAYALSEIATIYPITPVASMGVTADKWAIAGRKNLMGSTMEICEMESELGAAGATHGALSAGSLATTFTSSQGLLLMIPNMYKIAGELLPGVFHVGCRSVASHALSIFGDHQDVMACRATGFVMLSSSSVQETMDLALVAHLAAIEGSLPVLHFFDGWRTSNEIATVTPIPYEDMRPLVNWGKVDAFRKRALNPEHPVVKGTSQDASVYFQCREACNPYYDDMTGIVKEAMKKVSDLTGRPLHVAEYFGAPDADRVIISMGSSIEVIRETVEWLNSHGYKAGGIGVHLYRPFPAEDIVGLIPATAGIVAVLDRTKEPGATGEPLFLDVAASLQEAGRAVKVIGGRYGLSSKEFSPVMVKAVYDEMSKPSPRRRFTVGINDDVTHLSLEVDPGHFIDTAPDVRQVIFYGMGSDGTVGAARQLASIIADSTGGFSQAYFKYSAKKSGGYTISQLRYGPSEIRSEYSIVEADYIGCNKDMYVNRFKMLDSLKQGGIFVLNSSWSAEDMETKIPASLKRAIAAKQARFYNIDANSIAMSGGLGVRINTIMSMVFLHLMSDHLPYDTAVAKLKDEVRQAYMHEGGDVVNKNLAVMDQAIAAIKEISYDSSWATASEGRKVVGNRVLPEFVKDVAKPCLELLGDGLPVSAFAPDGTLPMGTAAYEKRRVALTVPVWNADKCVQCTECSLVCPHASIRPFVLDSQEAAGVPEGMTLAEAHSPSLKGLKFRIQVYPADCQGCGSCATVCPGHALKMTPIDRVFDYEERMLEYLCDNVSLKNNLMQRDTVNGSQLQQPLMEFSGACAGCGETPYVKLLTQLFGDRMIIANATGCSSIWGASYPSNPYCTDSEGRGPAWANSLFEDNAEYGYGMARAVDYRRAALKSDVETLISDPATPVEVVTAAKAWLAAFDSAAASRTTGENLIKAIKGHAATPLTDRIVFAGDITGKKSVWAVGGDGWAYDIGFAGLDHVVAQNVDINILVMDTECYSNTGGHVSKATPLGAVMKYAADGKRTYKKDLGRMMMTYGNVYVASVALGANFQQTINALMEAEAYPGPSIVIAYCPCINHGIRSGMSHSIVEEKLAVKAGYWPIYRFNPSNPEPLTVDAPAPDGSLITFINGEDRYADLRMFDPHEASILQPDLQKRTEHIYEILKSLSK